MTTRLQLKKVTTADLVRRFTEIAIERHDAMQDRNVRQANRLQDEETRICDELKSRGSDERQALLPLLDYPHVAVQCDAAGRCLGFAPEKAITVLETPLHCGHWNEIGGASFMLELYRKGKWKPT